jgi:translation initiation factor 3 subunit K
LNPSPAEVELLALSERDTTHPSYSPALSAINADRKYYRYQFNPHLNRDETITNILVKALTVFPNPDFSLALSLLPTHVLAPLSTSSHSPAAGDAPLSEAVQKLNILKNLLEGADYASFWAELDSDDLYADLVADVSGFEELMRVRIAALVSQAIREVDRSILESWLNLQGKEFEHFVGTVCGWDVDGDKIKVPINKDNEAKGTVVRENVNFDRKCSTMVVLGIANANTEFSRVVKRAYEQPA